MAARRLQKINTLSTQGPHGLGMSLNALVVLPTAGANDVWES